MDVIELAAVKYAEEDPYNRYEKCFIEGAKWQMERSYTEKEVKELLETQRGNCYVALLSHTKNDDIASIALQAPEPGGKNGTWIK